jgi:5-methylcytosine-specific restriction endonuclease McrA
MAEAILKACCRCKALLALGRFSKNRSRPDGLAIECKSCVLERVSAYQQREGFKEHKQAYDRARVARLKEKLSEQARVRYEKVRAERIAKAKAWVQANPEKRQAISQNYKHRRRGQEAQGITSRELRLWKEAQPKVCHWCGCQCERNFVVDHYVPLAKGGTHTVGNLVIACRPCNARKAARDPGDFARSIGRLL